MREATTAAGEPARRFTLLLPETEFRELAETARQETRTPDQQAVHYIRLALRRGRDTSATEGVHAGQG